MKNAISSILKCMVVSLLFFSLTSGTSNAYTLDWVSIQYRVNESGIIQYRLVIQPLDDAGVYVADKTAISKVVLKDEAGKIIPLNFLSFNPPYDFISAAFDTSSSSWWAGNTYADFMSDFNYEIQEDVAIGKYMVEITMDDGTFFSETIDFVNKLTLAYVPSDSFQIHMDSDGNVFWTWHTPEELFNTTPANTGIAIKASVAAFLNGELKVLYWPGISLEMGHCYIPSNVYQKLLNNADEIRFTLHVRTKDSQSRAYSDTISITDLSTPISISPNSSSGSVTINPDMSFSIPNASYKTLLGSMDLEVDFKFFGEQSGKLLWELESYKVK